MFLETDAIVLRARKSVENDVFLTLFSKKAGKLQVVANGARRAKSTLSACAKPFVCGSFLLYTKGRMPKVRACEIYDSHFKIAESLEALAYGQYLLELCDKSLAEGALDLKHYDVIVELLDLLARHAVAGDQDLKRLQLAYLLKLADFSGHAPQLDARCAQCGQAVDRLYFSVPLGGVACKACVPRSECIPIHAKWASLIRYLLDADMHTLSRTRIHPEYVERLLPIFEPYIQFHLGIEHINASAFLKEL